jgi:hypothetical protein
MKSDERERIPVEGRFGVIKRKYGLDCTMTKLEKTQRTSIALTILVLNLDRTLCPVHPARRIFFCLAVFVERRRIDRYLCPYFQGESVISVAA